MPHSFSVAIPTYQREEVLLTTLNTLFKQRSLFYELLVLDQTLQHNPNVQSELQKWGEQSMIRWIRLQKPSIPAAMNKALLIAESEIILFLDDDIIPSEELIKGHLNGYSEDANIWAVAGRVIQPWQSDTSPEKNKKSHGNGSAAFNFNSTQRQFVREVMAGNLSILRRKAVEIGGFDENFVGAAYRFETEFAERLIRKGGKILFEPSASIRHLKATDGGTRSFGDFRKTILPHHSVGAYYYFLRSGKSTILSCASRFFRSIYTKHHLFKPWWIPVTLMAEFSGFIWALFLAVKGPKYIRI